MTELPHLETEAEFNKTIEENENVMVCCGRMGPMCVPVYEIMEEIEEAGVISEMDDSGKREILL